MRELERGDHDPEWRADEGSFSAWRIIRPWLLLCGVLGVALLVAARGDGIGGWAFASCAVVGLLGGALDYLHVRRLIVGLRVDNDSAGTTLTLRRYDGQIRSAALADVEQFRITRNSAGDPEVLGIHLRVGRTRYRAVKGPNADALLTELTSQGVTVTTRSKNYVED